MARQKKPQSALQVPAYANAIADDLATRLDDSKKHVIGAAILGFASLPAETQVALVAQSRVEFAKSATPTPAPAAA